MPPASERGPAGPDRPLPLRPDDPPQSLPGIGPVTARALAELGVLRVADLLTHLPRRYEDRGAAIPVAAASASTGPVLLQVAARSVRGRRARRRRMSVVEAVLADATGSVPAVWFNQPWVEERLRSWPQMVVWGRLREAPGGGLRLINPEVHSAEAPPGEVVVRYPPLGPLSGARLRRALLAALAVLDRVEDPLPEPARSALALPPLAEALRAVHDPSALPAADLAALERSLDPAHRRLAFDELLGFAISCERSRRLRRGAEAPALVAAPALRREAAAMLPFRLTSAQRRVVGEILADLEGPLPMARLLQGDVGSGKTVVAAIAMLVAARCGRQAALMAPTELLAEQHHRTLGSLLAPLGLEPALLTASQPAAAARRARDEVAGGGRPLVVGTHALLQERVEFDRLALVIVDEQHRFGAVQRDLLTAKAASPHLLVMTATPIPRSLALTVYGDLDLSVIDELPPGRTPVRTEIRAASARPRVLDFLRREVEDGGRAYMVFPLIEASEEIEAEALEARADEIVRALPRLAVGVLHGRMPRRAREEAAERFRLGTLQVLLATTVIEVGVDVPEATVMVVESAERFGLSQLHQLRGRVGRGSRPAWCVLLVGADAGEPARERLRVFAATHDGFELAEADLRLRGPGELAGTRQWGPSGFRFADLVHHRDLIAEARRLALELAESGRLDAVERALAGFYGSPARVLPG